MNEEDQIEYLKGKIVALEVISAGLIIGMEEHIPIFPMLLTGGLSSAAWFLISLGPSLPTARLRDSLRASKMPSKEFSDKLI